MTTGYDRLLADWLTMTGWHNDWLGLLASIKGYPLLAIGNDLLAMTSPGTIPSAARAWEATKRTWLIEHKFGRMAFYDVSNY